MVIAIASCATALWFALTVVGLTPLRYQILWVAYGAAFWLSVNTALVLYAMRRIRSFKYGAERRRSIRFATSLTGSLNNWSCKIQDVSLTGALVCIPQPLAGVEYDPSILQNGDGSGLLSIVLDDVCVKLCVMIRSRHVLPSGGIEYGLEFADGQSKTRAKLALTLFNAQIIPEIEEVPEIMYS